MQNFANSFELPKNLLKKEKYLNATLKQDKHVRKVHPISILLSPTVSSQPLKNSPKVHPGFFKAFVHLFLLRSGFVLSAEHSVQSMICAKGAIVLKKEI